MLMLLSKKILYGKIKNSFQDDSFNRIDIPSAVREKWEKRAILGLRIGVYSITALFIYIVIESVLKKGFSDDLFALIFMYCMALSFSIFPLFLFLPTIKEIASEYKSAAEQIKRNATLNNKKIFDKQQEEQQRLLEERRRISEEERQIEIARKKRLQDIEDEEAAKARGKAKGLAELYKTQIELLVEYKRKGLDIEKEIYSMREKLLSLEKQENSVMVEELLQTLDRI
jgi:uncharacterized membrane protein